MSDMTVKELIDKANASVDMETINNVSEELKSRDMYLLWDNVTRSFTALKGGVSNAD